MRGYLSIIAAIVIVLAGFSVANATGIVSFASGAMMSFTSGAQIATYAPTGNFGISYSPSDVAGTDLTASYNQLLSTGATWLRAEYWWPDLQATSTNSFVWAGLDNMVNSAVAKGINVLVLLNGTPDWDTYPGCTNTGGTICAPNGTTATATMCSAVATHYKGEVFDYELRNEVNVTANWEPSATSSDYVLELNACANAMHAVDPTIKIVSSGLENAADVTGVSIAPTTFVTSMYANGAVFDILGFHPYTYPYTPSYDLSTVHGSGWYAMTQVRAIMVANGDSAKPIWATEFGAPTCGPGRAYGINNSIVQYDRNFMTFQAQEQIAQDAFNTMATESWLGKIFFYTKKDANSNDPSTTENCFGVFFTNNQPKLMYEVLRSQQ
jgi:hypothetical protein